MLINTLYDIGEIVYLVTDEDQRARMITRLVISNTGTIYYLACGAAESPHYDFELQKEKNRLASAGIGLEKLK
jgi:hypothetical protein